MMNKNNMTIRVHEGVPTEYLEALQTIDESCMSVPWLLRDWGEVDAAPHTKLITAEHEAPNKDPELVGFSVVTIYGTTEIERFCVATEHKRTGVGTRLLREVEKLSDASGALRISINVPSDAEGANRFFERWGFRPVGVRKNFFAEGDEVQVLDQWRGTPNTIERELNEVRGAKVLNIDGVRHERMNEVGPGGARFFRRSSGDIVGDGAVAIRHIQGRVIIIEKDG